MCDIFFFSSRRRHTRWNCDWSSDVCSSDLLALLIARSPRRHRDFMVLLVVLPFASNFLVRVYAWMIILGDQSIFLRPINYVLGRMGVEPWSPLFSGFAVIVGMVYVHLPFMILPLYTNLEKHDPVLLD